MDSPLRFCVACGRAITAEDLKHAGLKLQQGRRADASRSDLSRQDFSAQRKVRSFMYTVSAILALLIGYYCVMKYVLHEHMPGNLDVQIEQMIGVQSSSNAVAPEAAADVPASHVRKP
jgi:hypothetical protein